MTQDFDFIRRLANNTLEHCLVHYKERMHRPFTKLVLIFEDLPKEQISKYIDEASLGYKSIYAMTGVDGTFSPHFLNAVVKFDDIQEDGNSLPSAT